MEIQEHIAQLNALELQVESLVQVLQTLKAENLSLRQKLANSTHQRSRLQTNNQQAAEAVQQVIDQLKEKIA